MPHFIDISFGDRQDLIHILMRIEYYDRRHQLGDGGNRNRFARVFAIQHFTGIGVHDQSRPRLQTRLADH